MHVASSTITASTKSGKIIRYSNRADICCHKIVTALFNISVCFYTCNWIFFQA